MWPQAPREAGTQLARQGLHWPFLSRAPALAPLGLAHGQVLAMSGLPSPSSLGAGIPLLCQHFGRAFPEELTKAVLPSQLPTGPLGSPWECLLPLLLTATMCGLPTSVLTRTHVPRTLASERFWTPSVLVSRHSGQLGNIESDFEGINDRQGKPSSSDRAHDHSMETDT